MNFRQRHDPEPFLRGEAPAAIIEIETAEGSAPRAAGAWMLVDATACFGTIGGGVLEHRAIAAARALLATDGDETEMTQRLGPDSGQCCGGRVTLRVRRLNAEMRRIVIERRRSEFAAAPMVMIFGAGHVGCALSEAAALTPLRPVLIDTRADALDAAPKSVEQRLSALPESDVRSAPPGAAFVILTHDHELDFLIAAEALKRSDAAYIGMIGSKTKRARFESWIRRFDPERVAALARLTCPIGQSAAGPPEIAKTPEIIAAMVVAELIGRVYA